MSEKISLCMVVRDESAMLPEFFKAASGLWDELCVVDTGSNDDTVKIAEAAGARVFHHAWNDDFAAARNVGLDQAQGDWIVYLDPDELCTPELVASARAVSREAGVGAATLSMHNTLSHHHRTVTHLLRMFRHDPSIRFQHAIHEDVIASCLAYLRNHGRTLKRLEGYVEHVGYTLERAKEMDKKSRDVRILRANVSKDPSDLYCWFKLLEVARYWDDAELMAQTARQVAPLLAECDQEKVALHHFLGEMLTLIGQGLHPNDPQAALTYLGIWAPHVQQSAAYYLRCAELCERMGKLATAERAYTHCLGLKDVTANCQLATVRPMLGLARIALLRNDTKSALAYVDTALAQNHRDPEALLALATLSKRLGGVDAARKMADAYIDAYGDAEELWEAFVEAGVR